MPTFTLWLAQEKRGAVDAILKCERKGRVHFFGLWRRANEDLLQLMTLHVGACEVILLHLTLFESCLMLALNLRFVR